MNYLQIVANHIIKLDQVTSTNDYAINLLANNEPIDGTVITASFQTAGKGQYGRKWIAQPNNNILLSLILKPKMLSIDKIFYLNICISLAVKEFISNYTSKLVSIKWPNDIYIGDKKIAGILIQNQINSKGISSSVIGIGININQSQFHIEGANPTSLCQEENKTFNIESLLQSLYQSLDKYYLKLRSQQYQEIKSNYTDALYGLNQFRQFQLSTGNTIFGNIIGIKENGAINIYTSNNNQHFMMHEIRMNIDQG